VLKTGLVARAAGARAPRLTPVAADHLGAAVVLGAAAVLLLVVPPLTADGERLLYWSDLFLVPFAIGGVVWLRRQRTDYGKATIVPSPAKLAANGSVIRRHAAWGTPYLLFVVLVASSVPDYFGLGFVCGVFAVALALESRYATRWEARSGDRLYRGPVRWSKPEIYRSPR
jgi:hypothetical protein